MNKTLITLTFFSVLSFCGCNKKLDESPSTFVEITEDGSGISPMIFHKNRSAPWRLRFEIDDVVGDEKEIKIKIYFRNDDESPVVIYVNEKIGSATVTPHEKIIIFDGTLNDLKMCGRTEMEELTITTSRDRDVAATFLVESSGLINGSKLRVRAWALQYGF